MAVSMFVGLCTCHCLARGIYCLLVETELSPLPLKHIHTCTHMRAHTSSQECTKSSQVPGRNALLMQGKTTVSDYLVDTGPCDQNSLQAAND